MGSLPNLLLAQIEQMTLRDSSGGVAANRSSLLSSFNSRPTKRLRILELESSPLLISNHRVVMTLQLFARASLLGTFVYTPILRKNFISSFLASAVIAWLNRLPITSSKSSMSA